MLILLRRSIALALLGFTLAVAVQSPAIAGSCPDGSDPVPVEQCDAQGNCSVQLTCPGDDGGGGEEPGDGGGSSTCTHNGETIPCQLPGVGTWNGECYVTPTQLEVQPPPPPGQSEDDGAWYYCIYPSGGGTYAGTAWVVDGTTFIDPVVLAQRAIASMDLDPISIGIVPESGADRAGLVGLPVWMWVDNPTDDTFGPITESASEGSVSVSATASVLSIVWNMGDGTKVSCTGKGTPYADHYGKQPSPTCGHRYAKMSSDQPDGAYQVTATSHWVVEWTGGGQSGTIEFDLTTDPLPIRIGEAQVLTQ
ncbi:hypothetical protein KDN32_04270 [Nocardioides sp. J2M5]|uniref:hypothetical protein n=1 Tax=Nocardioides palaemonis TaxID=2829810 RepID=UPI001BAD8399|nr:hypothetical protein [Nocardioides palaemonis]MBS2936958.1 hypothetical protein [Nocardioides palaemonis]